MNAAPLDPAACYRALRARDPRFDGVFFVAVRTTGIYCRPVCPARTPREDRCAFYALPAEAEAEGFRACFRCRPELAPGLAAVDAQPRLVREATARIDAGYLNGHSVEALASSLGVTSRHLRRTVERVLGVTPVQLAQTRRLGLAKHLLQDSGLPLAEVALAAGFASIRRFNAVFQSRYGRPPSALRRAHPGDPTLDAVTLRLDYRPPLAWDALLAFLGARAIPGVEVVDAGEYRRTVALGSLKGWVSVRADPPRHALRATVSHGLVPRLSEVAARLRALFDLDVRPEQIAAHLGEDRLLRGRVRARPGLRVPGAFDGFELAVRAVLGQQVSVRGASTLSGRVAARWGAPIAGAPGGLERLFPDAGRLAALAPAELRTVGLPAARAHTLCALARATAGGLRLEPASEPERAVAALEALPGIGPWTAHYIAMRALRWPDAFPAGDLVLERAMGGLHGRRALRRAEPWRPWRAYAAMHLWS